MLHFLIIPRVNTMTGTMVVLRCYIFFSISISRFLYFLIWLYYLTNILYIGTAISARRHVFLLQSLKVWIAKSKRIEAYLDSVFGSEWCLYHIFLFQYSVLFAYFPPNILSYFIMPFFIFSRYYDRSTQHSVDNWFSFFFIQCRYWVLYVFIIFA